MRAVRPLSELLMRADEFIKMSSAAPAQPVANTSEEVEAVVSGLLSDGNADMDKVAEAFNRTQVAAFIETNARFEAFEKKAKENGFSSDQIEEAFSKLSAEAMKKNMPILVALGLGGFGKDKNSMSKKPVQKSFAEREGDLDSTKGMGY